MDPLATIEHFPEGLSNKDIADFYTRNLKELKKLTATYHGPALLAEQVKKHINNMDRVETILDVGAGLGCVGRELASIDSRIGKTIRIDALEPSEGMLQEAKHLNIYDQFIKEFVNGISSTSIKSESYDIVVSCGTFATCHIPAEGLLEMVRYVRIGGLLLIAMNDEYVNDPQYTSLPRLYLDMEKKGITEKVDILTGLDYFTAMKFSGTISIYRKRKPIRAGDIAV